MKYPRLSRDKKILTWQHMQSQNQTQLTDYQGSLFRRFTGKEKDSESGYYYFGARYFMPNLSIWNSVDPMADKYPSLSPYNYCAWNPMRLVDPNGEEVYIVGDAAEQVVSQLSSARIMITYNKETGKLDAVVKSKKLTYGERALLKAIKDESVKINVYATDAPFYDLNGFGIDNTSLTGVFLGADVGDCDNTNSRHQSVTMQLINPRICQNRDNEYTAPKGTSIRHEITESYQAGLLCIQNGMSVGPKYSSINGKPIICNNEVFDKAHKQATIQATEYNTYIKNKMSEFYDRIQF